MPTSYPRGVASLFYSKHWIPSGRGIRTLHVDALLPAEVNGSLLLMDDMAGFHFGVELSGWLNVFTSFWASSIPTLMEESEWVRARYEQWNLIEERMLRAICHLPILTSPRWTFWAMQYSEEFIPVNVSERQEH